MRWIDWKGVDPYLGIGLIIAYQAISALGPMMVVIQGRHVTEWFYWLFLAWVLLVAASITGLVMRKGWGRTLAIVHACLNLLLFPLGTIFGLLILSHLRSRETQRRYFRFEPA